jgi:hypothetical protein
VFSAERQQLFLGNQRMWRKLIRPHHPRGLRWLVLCSCQDMTNP